LRENGVIIENRGVFNKTVENIRLKQEKRVGSEYWALDGLNRFKNMGHGFGSGRLNLDRPMNQEVQI